jgi:hypothetical protein
MLAATGGGVPWGAIAGGLSALGGLFGGKRRVTYGERLANEDARKKSNLADRIEAMALAFDPERELRSSLTNAEASTGRALANANSELGRRFYAEGGNPEGDTAFRTMKRRTQDDILNPLASFAAEQRAKFMQMRMQALMQAFGARDGGGSLALQSSQVGMNAPQPNMAGSLGMLQQALSSIPGWGR